MELLLLYQKFGLEALLKVYLWIPEPHVEAAPELCNIKIILSLAARRPTLTRHMQQCVTLVSDLQSS